MKNMAEVEEFLQKLNQKPQDNYTPEQMHAWAHMIQNKETFLIRHYSAYIYARILPSHNASCVLIRLIKPAYYSAS